MVSLLYYVLHCRFRIRGLPTGPVECRTLPPRPIPPDNFPPNLGHFPWLLKRKFENWHTPDPNRSTSIRFVHVNGRPLRWLRGTVVERRPLTGELSLSCARPAADG